MTKPGANPVSSLGIRHSFAIGHSSFWPGLPQAAEAAKPAEAAEAADASAAEAATAAGELVDAVGVPQGHREALAVYPNRFFPKQAFRLREADQHALVCAGEAVHAQVLNDQLPAVLVQGFVQVGLDKDRERDLVEPFDDLAKVV